MVYDIPHDLFTHTEVLRTLYVLNLIKPMHDV